MIVNIYKLI